jgi:hypothetical protein
VPAIVLTHNLLPAAEESLTSAELSGQECVIAGYVTVTAAKAGIAEMVNKITRHTKPFFLHIINSSLPVFYDGSFLLQFIPLPSRNDLML